MFDPAVRASELAQTIINGNRKAAIFALQEMRPLQAAAVAFYIRGYLRGDDDTIAIFARLLDGMADDDSRG